MRKLGALWIALFSAISFADEQSVQIECGAGYREYQHNDTRLQLCPAQNQESYLVDAITVGSNYHTCWWPLTLSKENGVFSASKEDCTLYVTFDEWSLEAKFIGKCQYFCGARARFSSGKFFESPVVPKVSKPTKAHSEATSAQGQPIQLWTGHKLLKNDMATCASKIEVALTSLGFRDITKSTYTTEMYVYANLNENRVGLHCTSVARQTFVYGSVAGLNVKVVESLRNTIFQKL